MYRQCLPVVKDNVDFDVLAEYNEGHRDPWPLLLPVVGQAYAQGLFLNNAPLQK